MYRRLSVLLVLALAATACSQEADPTTTSRATTSTSTTILATTTTVPTLAIENAPPELQAMVASFYDYAAGLSTQAPPAPEPVLAALKPTPVETPVTGVASVGTFQGQGVATVEAEGDLFLAIDDGSGWRIVGGNWPNVSVPAYYGPAPRLVAETRLPSASPR